MFLTTFSGDFGPLGGVTHFPASRQACMECFEGGRGVFSRVPPGGTSIIFMSQTQKPGNPGVLRYIPDQTGDILGPKKSQRISGRAGPGRAGTGRAGRAGPGRAGPAGPGRAGPRRAVPCRARPAEPPYIPSDLWGSPPSTTFQDAGNVRIASKNGLSAQRSSANEYR